LVFGFCLTVWAIISITRLVCFGLFRLLSLPQPLAHYHQSRPFTDGKAQKPQPPHPSSPIRTHYPTQTTLWPQIIYNHTPMAEGPNLPQEIIPYLPPTGTNTINHINPTTNRPQNVKIAKQQGQSVLNQHKSMKK
jgi:hypothetical protein